MFFENSIVFKNFKMNIVSFNKIMSFIDIFKNFYLMFLKFLISFKKL